MSFKQKFISAVTFVFAIVAFTTFVSAQDKKPTEQQDSTTKQEKRDRRGFGKEGKRGGHRGGKMMMHGLRELNLTDAQKEQLKGIMESNRTANQATHEEMRGLMMKKRDGIITAEEQTRFDQVKAQMKASAEQTHNSILAILTPEQRTQLEQQKEQMKQKREEHRKMRQNQPQPDTQKDN
ncbi:MAG: Spy/CpxP family protein refolding chaperone [Acidobacteriota bacterium]|nr:Spy/CpxP family protein refolding chaperone [Acidobacteriota bacterium]